MPRSSIASESARRVAGWFKFYVFVNIHGMFQPDILRGQKISFADGSNTLSDAIGH
jgi:hypothetical protein